MDFSLNDEQKMVQQTVRDFVNRELIPLEGDVLLNEREGRPGLQREKVRELQKKAKDMGFWGINTPEEYGGANLGPIMTAIIAMELGRTFVPFGFGGTADNILYYCNEEQKRRYLIPTINGERRSCFALTEPGAGSDAANIKMRAVKDGDEWVLNGEKIFITNGNEADFAMVFAVTDPVKGGHGGVTCFLVDREMGWTSTNIPTMGDWGPASLYFEMCACQRKIFWANSTRASIWACNGSARDAGAFRLAQLARLSEPCRWVSTTPSSASPWASQSPSIRPSSG
jgi:acyl-CoA dehydrogenase